MLIARLDAPGMQELTTFWPLLPISIGLAILLVTRQKGSQQVLSHSRGGQKHGE
jgi:hypothetical protein